MFQRIVGQDLVIRHLLGIVISVQRASSTINKEGIQILASFAHQEEQILRQVQPPVVIQV